MSLNTTINKTELSESESITLRIALTSYLLHLHHNGLGKDDDGKALCADYLKNVSSILQTMDNL